MIQGGHPERRRRDPNIAPRLLAGAFAGLALLAVPLELVAAEGDRPEKVIPAFALVLLAVLGLVVVFLVGSLVIVRSARRHRATLGGGRRLPTPVSDVWATHRVPQDIVDGLDDDETDESP